MIHVAVGVVVKNKKEILIAKRKPEKHQGGLWEFPGGKVERNETVEKALSRELFEEVHIQVLKVQPLTKITHQYPDQKVLLNVFLVSEFQGDAKGKENQEVRWVTIDELEKYQFPEANALILKNIQNMTAINSMPFRSEG